MFVNSPLSSSSSTPLERPVTTTPPVTTPPVVTPTSTVTAPEAPKDKTSVQATQATVFSALGQNFAELPVLKKADVPAFFAEFNKQIPTSVTILADSVVIGMGKTFVKMSLTDLTAVLKGGNESIDRTGPLAMALTVAEDCRDAGLPMGATTAILARLQDECATHLAAGDTPSRALSKAVTDSKTQIACAVHYESYVSSKDGLSRDMRETSEFTANAFSSKTAGGDTMARQNRTLRSEVIKQHQVWLDMNLSKVTAAFADARASGNYAKAYDTLGHFFKESARINDTEHWRTRSTNPTWPNSLEKPTPSREVPSIRSALRVTSVLPKIDAPRLHAVQAQTAPSFFDRVKGWFKDTKGVEPAVVRGKVQPEAALDAIKGLLEHGRNPVATKGIIWQPKAIEAPVVTLPVIESAPVTPRTVTERVTEAVTTVVEVVTDKVQAKLLQTFAPMQGGDTKALKGELAVELKISLDFVDALPGVGTAVAAGTGLRAKVEFGADLILEKEAEVTRLASGQFQLEVTTTKRGGLKAGVDIGSDKLGLTASAEGALRVGTEDKVTMTFASAADLAEFLAKGGKGFKSGDTVGDKAYTMVVSTSDFVETETETASSGPVRPSEKSSPSSLPGWRTVVDSSSTRISTEDDGSVVHDIEISMRTVGGKSKEGVDASNATFSVTKRVKPDSSVELESPSVDFSIDVKKMQNLRRMGPEGRKAATALIAKMGERIKTVMREASRSDLGTGMDYDSVDTQVTKAIGYLQSSASKIFGGDGIRQAVKTSALGFTYERGNMAQVRFKLEPKDGKLTLGDCEIGVASKVKADFKLSLKFLEIKAGLGYEAWRKVGDSPPPLLKKPLTPETELYVHDKSAGRLHFEKTIVDVAPLDKSKPVTKAAVFSNGRVELKSNFKDLLTVISSTAKAEAVKGLEDSLIKKLTVTLATAARAQGFLGEIDPAKAKQAIQGAIMLLRSRHADLQAHQADTDYSIEEGGFQATIRKRGAFRDDKLVLEFDFEQDPRTGKFAPINPITQESVQAKLLAARDAAVTSGKKRAETPLENTTMRDGRQVFYTKSTTRGINTPVSVLQVPSDALIKGLKAMGTAKPADYDALVTRLVKKLHTKDLPAAAKGSSGWRGVVTESETRTSIVNTLAFLKTKLTELEAKKGSPDYQIAGSGFMAAFSGKKMINLNFELLQDPENASKYKLSNPTA